MVFPPPVLGRRIVFTIHPLVLCLLNLLAGIFPWLFCFVFKATLIHCVEQVILFLMIQYSVIQGPSSWMSTLVI